MIGYLRRRYQKHLDEVLSTIKLMDVEERFDIYFSRFYGLYLAKLGRWLRMTPTQVSIISLFIGIAGGALLYFQEQLWLVAIGAVLIILAGVLDSADGQLARMTNQSTEMGRVIDGLIDNLVFISCYVGGTLYLVSDYSPWIFLLTLATGYAHSYKAAVYEFYKSEYVYFVGRTPGALIPLSKEEIQPTGKGKWYHKIIDGINYDYTSKQIRFTTRTKEERAKMIEIAASAKSEKFLKRYAEFNSQMLFWWAWLGGSNTHRNTLIGFALFARFDLFLVVSLIWTLGYIPLNRLQRRYDQRLLKEFAN